MCWVFLRPSFHCTLGWIEKLRGLCYLNISNETIWGCMNLELQCSSLQLSMNSLSASREFDSILSDFIHMLNNAGQFEYRDFSVLPIDSVSLLGFIWTLTTEGRKQRCLPCKCHFWGRSSLATRRYNLLRHLRIWRFIIHSVRFVGDWYNASCSSFSTL